jgi:NADH:ubiquinone oxidoreductase subunit D
LNFNIPISTHGDCFSRYLLRILEMRESCKIINQVLNKIKPGIIKTEDFTISSFKNQIINSMENLIAHYKLYSSGILFNQKEEYTSV